MGEAQEGSQPARNEPAGGAESRNAGRGRALFALYLVLYGGFVLINAFWPSAMEATPVGGVNLAILYGLGLIASALLLALAYAWICRGEAH